MSTSRTLILALALSIVAGDRAAGQTPVSCCSITGIQPSSGIVSAKVAATGSVFQFTVASAAALARLKVGQAIYANFTTRQVSLDGRAACCAMLSGPQAPAVVPGPIRPPAGLPVQTPAPAPAPPPPAPVSRVPVAVPPPAAPRPVLGGVVNRPVNQFVLPTISYGTPQPRTAIRTPVLGRFDSRPVSATVGGRNVSTTILHLRGLDGIEKAPGLPDGVRRLLEMHVRTLAAGESDHYIVNIQLAEDWIAAHPVPPDVKPSDGGGNSHSGCNSWSMHCVSEAGQHAVDQGSKEWQKLWQQAVDEWNHVADELTHDWNMAQGCFADHTLPLGNVPVQFSITPGMTLHLEQSGSQDLSGGGSASGTVQGTVGIGFPIQSDFLADVDLFYIPCLPFMVRPKRLSGTGTLTVGEQLKASVTATGKFDKVYTIPPSGGPQIIIEVIPIVIGGVPVAELDVSAYIEGSVEVGGSGKADGQFQIDNPHKARFDFSCTGKGCTASSKGMPAPTTSSEGAELKGQVFVKPAIYTALQLDLDVDALSARAGPQPYLLGTASGCAAVAGSQTVGGGSTSGENHALTGDLDWGVELRAEALVLREVVGQAFIYPVMKDQHLWFRDLAPGGSTALVAAVDGAATATAGTASVYKVRMPSCYPYSENVHYRVAWTGNATPAPLPQCQWQAGQGTCTFDPKKDLPISLTWPAAGSYSLTVVPVGDDHKRTFSPAPAPTQMTVVVR